MIPKSELRTKEYLKRHGYYFIRAGRSFGIWDFIASNDKELLYIQCKSNQAPRKAEIKRLMAFNSYPKAKFIKRQIWVWKAWGRKPIIKNAR